MTAWTQEQVLHQAQEWVWAPPGTTQLRMDWCHALHKPGSGELSVAWIALDAAPEHAWSKLTELAVDHDCGSISVTVSDTTVPAGFEDLLVESGAELLITHQVMGWDLTQRPFPAETADGVRVEVVDSVDRWLAAASVAREVWGGEEPTEADQVAQAAVLDKPIEERGGFQVIAWHHDQPAATAGVTLAGSVARLWGACTRPAFRGQGAYRATVTERLRVAAEHGATLGLTNAKVDTSAPILDRLGFKLFGGTRNYLRGVDSGAD